MSGADMELGIQWGRSPVGKSLRICGDTELRPFEIGGPDAAISFIAYHTCTQLVVRFPEREIRNTGCPAPHCRHP